MYESEYVAVPASLQVFKRLLLCFEGADSSSRAGICTPHMLVGEVSPTRSMYVCASRSTVTQATKYRELAGARGVQVAQLETEVSSLKATNRNLRRM